MAAVAAMHSTLSEQLAYMTGAIAPTCSHNQVQEWT